jgi:hypothetical protein
LNEPERVYCHNCGSKLDRSLLPKTEEKKQEGPEKARKRIAKMTNPQGSVVVREIKALFKVAFWSAVLAAVIQIVRPPEGVPDPKAVSDRLVSGDMADALESPQPRGISFTQDEINSHLKRKVKAKETMVPGVQVTRIFVNLRPGTLRLCPEYDVWGYPMYAGVEYSLEVKDGKFTATPVGGNLGRLSLHPELMKYVEPAFAGLHSSVASERKQMDQIAIVKVEDKRIDLATKGAANVQR